MKKLLFLSILIQFALTGQSQAWRYVRHEVQFGVGASNFLGDLGGSKGIGTHGIKDLRIKPTRPTLTAGYKFMITPAMSVRAVVIWGYLSGDDAHTKNVIRNNRNLSFRSMIGEMSALYEYYPWGDRVVPNYKVTGIAGTKSITFIPYFYTGVGVSFFNPKAKYNGDWVALQPLATEGQGLAGRPDKYKRVTMTFPIGAGLKYMVDRQWSISLDLSLRYTLSDYIDDVSTSYYRPDLIEANYGTVAADLSDRAVDPSLGFTGAIPMGDGRYNYLQRGNPKYNDAYMFAIISVHYRFKRGQTFIPKF
ncbi:MAG: hypothetical protein JNJ99_13425 [Crocinitomicaceae bacterium]|nr:hypothetical protein [Crocinitomicaceae bacterium]